MLELDQSGEAVVVTQQTNGTTGWGMYLQVPCSINGTPFDATSPNITAETEVIISTLDIRSSCKSIIIVLCLTMLTSSVMSPTLTVCPPTDCCGVLLLASLPCMQMWHMQNCVKEPIPVKELEMNTEGSLASKLFGERFGHRHCLFVEWFGKWIILLCLTCEMGLALLGESETTKPIAAAAYLIFCSCYGLSLHTPTVKKLALTAGCWYYVPPHLPTPALLPMLVCTLQSNAGGSDFNTGDCAACWWGVRSNKMGKSGCTEP